MPPTVHALVPLFQPIVPVSRPSPFNGSDWLFEPKYDGFRGMLYLTGRSRTLYSKRGNDMKRFRGLAEQLGSELSTREVVLDGEIVALDDEGRISFPELMRGHGTLAYVAFDLLWLDGQDLRPLPLSQRKRRLNRLIPRAAGALSRIPCFENEGKELFEAACRLDLEGVVAKRKRDPYEPSVTWYKIKNAAYTQSEGRRELFER
jgi:bifunctional non-homologous end joining protein LigD